MALMVMRNIQSDVLSGDVRPGDVLRGVRAEQEVIGTDGGHVGVVRGVEGGRICLGCGDEVLWIEAELVKSSNAKVHLRVTAAAARSAISLR